MDPAREGLPSMMSSEVRPCTPVALATQCHSFWCTYVVTATSPAVLPLESVRVVT